jgi:hypothetical protein
VTLRTPRVIALTVLGVVVASRARDARADELDMCVTASAEGEALEKDGKLVLAHDRFVNCTNDSCPADVVEECTRRAREVDFVTPSVVVLARDAEGQVLDDVRVSIDGAAPVSVSGRVLALDPGEHEFVFHKSGEADVLDVVRLHEGEKNRLVAVTYPMPPPPLPKVEPNRPPARRVSRPVPTGAWVAGGISAFGFAAFAILDSVGMSARSSDRCATGCSSSQRSSTDAEVDVADVFLGVGVAALGVAAWQFFARPSVPSSNAATVGVHPMPGGGIATFAARF